ncbi:tRNA pseudouridine(38-40) synthase TruA [Neisseria perflava]|uniref:tRNA pseudouridine(38-40) synthase TruA n=1 Tax=Neisseria perflava TaxID=33053 RepID=UPI00209EC7A6|nr:tRNA pseudouridine(38-40) synthase TruA [Neisseria perflava]MCP1659937.1 tRNA pseudouridine38-40 synthase [Neisseria perflava]MCP1772215.1 tRNA pseudouridine38-40 synthase [Neisseria perflava]
MTEYHNPKHHTLQRWALIVSYDGSRFYGWQKQAGGVPTVQTALEHALSEMAGESVSVTVAGRTDTGVHATAQVLHFDTSAVRPEQAWIRGVNAKLPPGIAVLHAQKVAAHFHARFDAYGRRYRYLLQTAPVRSPLLIGKVGWTHLALNLENMQQAAALLEGIHDFSSFRASQCQAKSPVKTIYQAKISESEGLIKLDLHGNAFLHHMVRNIMGALVYVGCGKLSVADFSALMEEKSRLKAPPTFMPDGLYLTGVDYLEEFGIQKCPVPEWL